jgi:hypothetical protein
MDVDGAGQVYIAAAFDPEDSVANPDNGPFRSIVFRIGRVADGEVVLDLTPTLLAAVDGMKVESVVMRDGENSGNLFIGTDDENHGGTLRLIPPLDLP